MNLEELVTYLLSPIAQVALVMGIAELLKKVGFPAKAIPIVDLVLGIISGVCVFGIMQSQGIDKGVIVGIAIGLSACGLFSGIKNVTEIGESNND